MAKTRNDRASLLATALGTLLMSVAAASAQEPFSLERDEFDGSLTASTGFEKAAATASDSWTVFVSFSAELAESGERKYLLGDRSLR